MQPIIVTYSFNSNLESVWNALSKFEELKKWFFEVENFKFEIGNEFSFYETGNEKKYLHKCKFIDIVPNQKIEYSWEFPQFSKGKSIVKWEIITDNEKIKVVLTHTGVESFSDAGEDFSKNNFEIGWDAIVKNSLKNYLYKIPKVEFNIEINSTCQNVWKMLWDKNTYTIWTTPFCEGTYFEGDLKQGERIHFLNPNGGGMYSDIAFLKENELIVFKHIGWIKDKKEIPINDETEKWTNSFEAYKLQEVEGKTFLKVEIDIDAQYVDWMKEKFPFALNELKKISEAN